MITFVKPIDTDIVLMAYNNNVLEFSSTSLIEAIYCDMTIIDAISGQIAIVRLYPRPDGTFYVNMKPYLTALINTRNFEDTLQTQLPDFFVYGFANGSCLELSINFLITLENNTTDFTIVEGVIVLPGAEQIGSIIRLSKDYINILSPFRKDTTNKLYLKYWEGYPFDITLLSLQKIYLRNNTILSEYDFNLNEIVSRLAFSDGRTDETLEGVFPLSEGYNQITVSKDITDDPVTDRYLTLEKIPYTCGVYLKWLNKYGGYNYWLFENTYSVDRSVKSLGEIDRDYTDLSDTFTRALQIGKESNEVVKVVADLLTADEMLIVQGIIESPKVYLFTGQPFSRYLTTDWVEVNIKNGTYRIKNAKEALVNLSFDLELPQRYTQTL